MKRILFILLPFALIACKNNQIQEIPVDEQTRANAEKWLAEQQAQQVAQSQNYTNTVSGSSTSVVSNVRLNPPHGQPGHRCEIPVGAPLDGSAPVQTEIQQPEPIQVEPTPQPVQVEPTPAPQQTAAGFSGKPNPPHGQPGHRCDISVGAILP